MGEEGRPHGVGVGGMRARGVNGGWGRAERPVPPIMAMGTGSRFFVSVCWELWDGELACVCGWEVVHFGSGPEASEGVREWILMEEGGGGFWKIYV